MPSPDLQRLAIHTITTRPWSLDHALAKYAAAGIGGVTVWRQALQPYGAAMAGKMIRASGLACSAFCRGGFFPSATPEGRANAIADNKRCLDEAAEVGAPMVVLVCGAVPGQPLSESRKQIADAIATLEPHAAKNKVKLAIEPLHPMYAADRSAINTLKQAREICDALKSPWVGIAADVYHIWWDSDLESEIKLTGERGYLFGFHLCDWRVETRDLLNDRGLMGEGCIPLKRIRGWVEAAGFNGWNEIEIFSNHYWNLDQDAYLAQIKQAYLEHC
jgi:sugar phosphate isomerase/epimerase